MGQWLPAVNQHQVIFSYSFSFFLHFLFLSSLSQRHCFGKFVVVHTFKAYKTLSSLFLLYFFTHFLFSVGLPVFSPLFRAYKTLSSLFFSFFFPPFLISVGLCYFSPFSEHIKLSPLCFFSVFFPLFSSLLDSVFPPLFRAYKILSSLFFSPLFSSLLDSQSPATLLSVSSYFPLSRTHYFTQFLELKP